MKNYSEKLKKEFRKTYELAEKARAKGFDPSKKVEILPANDLAERVENLIGIDGLANRINELEEEGYEREEICLEVTDSLINRDLGKIRNKPEIAEKAVRTSVALLTEGIVAAPIEGISEVSVEGNDDYLRISYSGPIRSAGGTAQVVSVLVGDYVRRKLGIGKFEATEEEIERYAEEISLYKRLKNLQYTPSKKEINTIIANCPILVDGEATEDEKISGQRNLERIKTNRVRGGMCLVVAEGLALKAPKLKRLVSDLDIRGWRWLDKLTKKDEGEDSQGSGVSAKYLSDLIAGRPVFSHPSRPGGFRLRYGRARNSGLATAGINPASMYVLEEFLSTGTQIKFEKPGKAAGIVSVDSIEGPTVKLEDGEVIRIDNEEKARKMSSKIVEILDVGEMLVNYGDFLENNHKLPPPSFTKEWWKLIANQKNTTPSVSSAIEAIRKAAENNIPLHPDYTYLWHDLEVNEIKELREEISKNGKYDKKLKIPNKNQTKEHIEKLLIEHKIENNEIVIDQDNSLALLASLGLNKKLQKTTESTKGKPIEYINDISSLEIKKKAPTRIGCRMGRPEKSKERKMSPPTHLLYPVGEAGGKERDIEKATSRPSITVELNRRKCNQCEKITYKSKCPNCGTHTQLIKKCPNCDIVAKEKCPKCSRDTTATKEFEIKLDNEYKKALNNLGERNNYKLLKGVKGLTSRNKSPEPLEKGILRAKHDQYIYKDGTIRYDLTDLPLTHFKPKEIDTSIEKLKELGYKEDIEGEELKNEDQVLELKVQDVILSQEACNYLLDTTKFIDDLLEEYYGIQPYYEAQTINDLKGTLLVGLAPHTSAGVLARLIGSTKSQANYAHPYFHAAKRRNCLPGETEVKSPNEKNKTLRQIFEEGTNPKKVDDLGTIEKEINKEVISVRDNEIVSSDATKAYRAPAPNHKIEVVLASGKKLELFPDHRMKTKNQDKIRAKKLEKGDELIIAKANNSLNTVIFDEIKEKRFKKAEEKYMYDLEVNETHNFVVNENIVTSNCDGDEDCYMLLLDGLLNFSRSYLPDKTGGRMDAPLVLTYSLDPKEVDDEAHNIDIAENYPLEFYEAAQNNESPKEVDIEIGEDRLNTDNPLTGFGFTTQTTDISSGPKESSYKRLSSMVDKTKSQLELARKIKAVDERDVAERIIESHFLPDLMGNLRAFSTQRVRCVQCNTKLRRPPLIGKCPNCGGSLTLTVHENSVKKYLEISKEVAEEYDVSNYVKERLSILELSMESLFENDLYQQKGLSDFM